MQRRRIAFGLIGALLFSTLSAALPPSSVPLAPQAAAASGEVVASPRFVSAAVMPNGQVGLAFLNVNGSASEIRFKRYTSEFATDPSIQLSTAGPWYPQLATFRGELVAAYVDTRSPNSGKLAVRVSTDNGLTWTAESYPLGSATFDTTQFTPVVVASRDGQTLYVFSAASGVAPQYQSTADPALVTWTASAPAGDASIRVPSNNQCGNAGQECSRAHAFEFMPTALAGRWLYITKSDAGFGQSGRGTQYGTLGGSWSAQIDLGGSGGLSGSGGQSTATSFLDRSGTIFYLRVLEDGTDLYLQQSTDNGASWGPQVYLYSPAVASYLAAAPVGLYVPGYSQGEYVWWAGFGGTEDTVRVDGLWSAPAAYPDTGTARLFGSAGGDYDTGLAYAYTFGQSDPAASVGSGVYATAATDLALPGRLLPLSFTRTYNSADLTPGPLGRGWTHSYNWKLSENGSQVVLRRGDGRRDTFTKNPDGSYADPPGVFDALTKNADASFTLTAPTQTTYEFVGPAQTLYPAAVQADGPAAYWRLGESAGTTAADSGPNGDSGSYSGGYTQGVRGALRDASTAVGFNGVDAQVSAGATGIPSGTAARTVEAWVKPSGSGGAVLAANAAGGQKFILLDLLYSGTWYVFTDGVNGQNSIALAGAQIPPLGAWSHIAFVFDGPAQTWHYYLNGVPSGSGTFAIPLSTSAVTSMTIGARLDTSQPYNGALEEVAVYAKALSAAQIAAHYQANAAIGGLLSRIHEPAGNQITLGYSGTTLTQITDTVGRRLALQYDPNNHLSWLQDPSGRRTSYAYDPSGRLASVWTKSTTNTDRYASTVLADGPVGYWRLGESGGTSAADASPSADAGTYGGGIALGQAGALLQDTHTAARFDGATAQVTAGTTGIPSGSAARTVEAWVKPSGSGGTILATNASSGQKFVFYGGYHYSDGNTYLFTDGVNASNNIVLSGSQIPPSGAWSHLAFVFDGGANSWHYYLNGVAAASGTFPVAINTSAPTSTTIGTRLDTTQPYSGTLQEVAIYPAALSAAQIAAHYAASTIPASWQYGYDGSSQHLSAITDPDGRVRLTNSYDGSGRLATQRNGLPKQTSFAYGASTTTLTDPRGHQTTLSYDPRQRLLSQSDVVSGVTRTLQYAYDGVGDRTMAVDRDGNRTDFTFDTHGNVLTRTDPQLNPQTPRAVTTYAYDQKNNLTSLTDPRGFVITNSYDPTTNVLLSTSAQIDAATSAQTEYEYTDSANPGRATWITAPRGDTGPTPDHTYATSLGYDGQGNLVTKIDADAAKTTFVYDAVGRRTSTVDPDGYAPGAVPADHTWTTAYDPDDRTTAETDPLGHAITYGYDKTGDRTSVTDRNGNTTAYSFDAAAQLASVVQKPDPLHQPSLAYTTTLSRDDDGNVTTVTQANSVATDYRFDELNRITRVTSHPTTTGSISTTYSLNGNGQPTSKTLGDGTVITYSYDTNARLVSLSATGLTTIGYGYDSMGHRTQLTDVTGSASYSYDGLGRLTQAAQPNGTLTYGYDRDGNRTALGYPTVGTVTYRYSPGGRLASLTDWANRTSSYTYTPSGLAASVSLPGGMTTTYGYDRAHRLTTLSNAVGATTVSSHAYTLDAAGNRTALDEFVAGITTGAADHFGYGYDGLERLTAVTTTNPEGFTLDPASNLASRTGPAATYSYDSANRLTSDGTRSFSWNADDQLTLRGSDSFSFDPLDRLTGSTVGGVSRAYAYNGDGLLQSRSPGVALLWDPATAPSRLLQLGSDRLVYGLGPLYAVRADGSTVSFARDGGKSVRAEVAGTGAVTGSFRYLAYGQLVQSSGASSPTYLGYAGQLVDPTGLSYMRARWYDPTSGRFMTRDPIPGEPAVPVTLGAYGYAGANPLTLADPSGRAATAVDETSCDTIAGCDFTPQPAPRENWAYAIADVFGDLDSTDPGTKVGALLKVSTVAVAVAIPVGIAAAPTAVAVTGTAATAGAGTVTAGAAAGAATQVQRFQSLEEPIARLGEPSNRIAGAMSWEAVFRDTEGINWGLHWIEREGQILYGPNLRPWVTWTWGH